MVDCPPSRPNFGTHIYNPGSFGSDFMGKPEALAQEVAKRLGLYEVLPEITIGMGDEEFGRRFDVGIYPLNRKTRLQGLNLRLGELLLAHERVQELERQRTITVAELKKIDDDFRKWQRQQKEWKKRYPPTVHSASAHHDVDEGSRAEYDCCGL